LNPDDVILEWSAGEAEHLLSPLGDRWLHVQGVAMRARRVARALPVSERPRLLAAAYLHDVGWAPTLRETGFHPLDGARWARRHGHDGLARLIAHHSGARFEAQVRGLDGELGEFEREDSATADALTFCDLTTSPRGEQVTVAERMDDIVRRYGARHVVAVSLGHARASLLEAVSRTEALLSAARMTGGKQADSG
jgi:HD domain